MSSTPTQPLTAHTPNQPGHQHRTPRRAALLQGQRRHCELLRVGAGFLQLFLWRRRDQCAPGAHHEGSLCERVEDLKLDALYVVYPGRHRYRLSDRVEAVPLWALLQARTAAEQSPVP